MAATHQFGGNWTKEKLNRLNKYLSAYTTIFTRNVRARNLRTIYVDAFAGSGYHSQSISDSEALLPLFNDTDVESYQKGSAYIALETQPSFDSFLFVEMNPDYASELEKLKLQFPDKAIRVVQYEANAFLQEWIQQVDWSSSRAVVFLDPYGMQVEWKTIEALAQTKAVDLWLLFPLGQAVNRLLTKSHPPEGAWADRLTLMFGTDDWKDAFYRRSPQLSLFDEERVLEKEADFDSIGRYFVERLDTVFERVAQAPLPLRNSKNVPIFLLCFAASNPRGAPTAVKIAQEILKG